MPRTRLLAAMGNFNEELVVAGLPLGGEALDASVRNKRLQFSGGRQTLTDGPFA